MTGLFSACQPGNIVGASLLAIAVSQSHQCRLTWRYREQARSYRGLLANAGLRSAGNIVGASLLAIAVSQSHQCRLTWRYREQARSHRGLLANAGLRSAGNIMGASLLAIAVSQSHQCRLTWRYREQARSHRGYVLPLPLITWRINSSTRSLIYQTLRHQYPELNHRHTGAAVPFNVIRSQS